MERKVYVRPEDLCDLILGNLDRWNTIDLIKQNISKIKRYLKKERFDKLQSEFNLTDLTGSGAYATDK